MLLALTLGLLALPSCGGGNETLESFQTRWYDAVNKRDAGPLYDMLDSVSQREVREKLERVRGLPADKQQFVIDQLGGDRVTSMLEVTPQRYFALLWHQLTEGKPPKMSLEAAGADAAYMILTMDNGKTQRIRLVLEGGRWCWTLPKADREATSNTSGVATTQPHTMPQ